MVALASLWGASFIFVRAAVPDFGPIALAAVRVFGAALCLVPIVLWRGQGAELIRNWKHLFVCGVLSLALPFALVSYALMSLTGGLASIFNATTPLWGAIVAWVWLGDRLSGSRIMGLLIGFAGVSWLAWTKASFTPDATGQSSGLAITALLFSTLFYALGVSYTKRFLGHVAPLVTAAGSQVGASVMLAVPAALWWPTAMPSAISWASAALLAVASTAVAYILFFRLIDKIGPSNAIATTFLVPAFASLWGWLVFSETLSSQMVIGCVIIVCGTVLAVGLVKLGRSAPANNLTLPH
ncbi:DMT family transporter [soil metagenome]